MKTRGIELRPAGRKYPSVVLTADELDSILQLIATEFEWTKDWREYYPYLDSACAKLEIYEELNEKELTERSKK